MTHKPRVTIIIAVLNVNEYLRTETLPALKTQTFRNFEVILLPNALPDDAQTLKAKYPWLRLLPTHSITRPAAKRNIGASKARGSMLAFIDDDSFPAPTWLEQALHWHQKKGVAALCGPGAPPATAPFWEKVFHTLLTTRLGSGAYTHRFTPEKARFVDDYPSVNLFVEARAFSAIGGFNSEYWPGEDSKLCKDIVYTLKERIFYHPKILVYHHRRPELNAFLRQHARYGLHRGAFFAQGDKNSRSIVFLIPPLFALYVICLPILLSAVAATYPTYPQQTALTMIIGLVPILSYSLLCTSIMLNGWKRYHSLPIGITASLVIPLMHLTYGINFFIGILKRKNVYGRNKPAPRFNRHPDDHAR